MLCILGFGIWDSARNYREIAGCTWMQFGLLLAGKCCCWQVMYRCWLASAPGWQAMYRCWQVAAGKRWVIRLDLPLTLVTSADATAAGEYKEQQLQVFTGSKQATRGHLHQALFPRLIRAPRICDSYSTAAAALSPKHFIQRLGPDFYVRINTNKP